MPDYKLPSLGVFEFQRSVKDKDLSSPPGSPAKGDRYIVAATGSGDWTGHTKKIALCTVGGFTPSWEFTTPIEGMICWVNDEDLYYFYNGSVWRQTEAIDNFTIEKDTSGNLKVVDRIELNIDLLAFYRAVDQSKAYYNLIDGFIDEYQDQTGINTGASSGQTYDGTNKLYTTQGLTLDLMEYATDGAAQAAYITNLLYGVDATPTMTGYTTPSGTVSASGNDVGYESWRAFDNNSGTLWEASNGGTRYIQYQFASAILIGSYTMLSSLGTYAIKYWTLHGSNNGSTWTLLDTQSNQNISTKKTYTFSNIIAYSYYKITDTSADTYTQLGEMELLPIVLQSYSEATIKTQGTYSLKGIAEATISLNKTLTRTVSPTINLSGQSTIKFSIYASRTGSNIKIGIHDSGGVTTEITPNITSANVWQTITWDISGVSNANKDVIDSIIITIVNADAANTFYLDNMISSANNMILIANVITAVAQPTNARIVLFEEDIDAVTLNTDLLAYVSIDNGANYDQVTLASAGNYYSTTRRILSGIVNVSIRTGTSVIYKIVTTNNKALNIRGTALNWE